MGELQRSFVEQLEHRRMLAGHVSANPKLLAAAAHLDSSLWGLYQGALGEPTVTSASKQSEQDRQQNVAVTLFATHVEAVVSAMKALGFDATAVFPSKYFAEGVIPISSLGEVATAGAGLGRFALAETPQPVALTGSVDSQADSILGADRVRSATPQGFDGTGVRIGVLSDTYNYLGGAAADVASGDLPSDVSVLQDYNAGGTDEGRAMLQVIHDLAPGASLAFATASGGEGNFANNISRLADPADGNAKIIVDDVVYPTEPMFQDGIIAQAIDDAVTANDVSYFSAAGNFGTNAYESTTFQSAPDVLYRANGDPLSGTFYDFNSGPGVDTRQRITVPAGGQITLSLQWDNPFYTDSGVQTDLDIFLTDPNTGKIVTSAENDNILMQEPNEVVQYDNRNATPMALDVSILKFDGPDPGRIKYVNYGSPITFDEYATNSPTVVPHAAAVDALGVAAVPYFDPTTPEPNTSRGPGTILFEPDGTAIAAQIRQAPQIASIDDVNNTFFGQDTDGDGKPNFVGTSAATAHAAAVAALLRQADPTFTPAQVYARLQNTAKDVTPVGFDNTTGYGLIDAYDAVFLSTTSATPGTPDLLQISDTGISNSDDLTNFDNHDSMSTLKFNIPGTVSGATVTLYADGVALGSAVADGSSTTVTTDGTIALSNVSHQFTAREKESGKSFSTNSSPLAVTIDTIAPSLVRNASAPKFLFETSPHGLLFNFTESVAATLAPDDLVVERIGAGSGPPQATNVNIGPNDSAIFALNGIVTDGRYRATIDSASVTDAAGNKLAGDTTFDFFFLTGDANHDGQVDTLDFTMLAQHFNQQATGYSQGNFNYDDRTNALDFNALATVYGTSLPMANSSPALLAIQVQSPPSGSLFLDALPSNRKTVLDVLNISDDRSL